MSASIPTFSILLMRISRVEERWLTEKKTNPEALLSLCVRPLFCMHPQLPQAWTALHSHAAIAPELWCWGARGFWGHAENGMRSTLAPLSAC